MTEEENEGQSWLWIVCIVIGILSILCFAHHWLEHDEE